MPNDLIRLELALRELATLFGVDVNESSPWEDENGNWSEEKLRAIFPVTLEVAAFYAAVFPEQVEAIDGQADLESYLRLLDAIKEADDAS